MALQGRLTMSMEYLLRANASNSMAAAVLRERIFNSDARNAYSVPQVSFTSILGLFYLYAMPLSLYTRSRSPLFTSVLGLFHLCVGLFYLDIRSLLTLFMPTRCRRTSTLPSPSSFSKWAWRQRVQRSSSPFPTAQRRRPRCTTQSQMPSVTPLARLRSLLQLLLLRQRKCSHSSLRRQRTP